MEAITREEMFLSDIAGDTKYNLEPITRTEKLLKKIAENGTGGGGFDPVVTYGDTLTWDGNTEGLISVDMGGMFFYRIADNVITLADCPNGLKGTLLTGSETSNIEASYETLESSIGFSGMINLEAIWFVPSDNFTVNDLGITVPKAGVYCLSDPAIGYVNSITIPGYAGFETTTYPKIPIESLPEGYPYVGEGVILAEQKFTAAEQEAGVFILSTDAMSFVSGIKYTVTIDGTAYETLGWEFSAEGMTATGLGNLSLAGVPGGTDTGEPFTIMAIPGNGTMCLVLNGEGDGLSATIGIKGEVVHKMDEKYLPELPSVYIFRDLITEEEIDEAVANNQINAEIKANELLGEVLLHYKNNSTFYLETKNVDGVVYRYPFSSSTCTESGGYVILGLGFAIQSKNFTVGVNLTNFTGD